MGYNLLINGVYWGYNPLTNHLVTSWDSKVHFSVVPALSGRGLVDCITNGCLFTAHNCWMIPYLGLIRPY